MFNPFLKISSFINSLAVKINFPLLNALIFYINLKKLNINYQFNTKKTIIVLYRHDGVSDLKEAYANYKSPINFLILPRRLVKDIFNYYLKDLVNDYYYIDIKDNTINENKKKYFNYLEKVLKILGKMVKFDAMLSFNVFYYAERELQRVCKSLGIKYLVLMKEGISTAQVGKQILWQFKNTTDKFYGDKIATYNENRRNLLIKGGIISKKDVKAIGIPRYDKIHEYSKRIDNRNRLIYFSIRKNSGFFNTGKNSPIKYKFLEKKFPLESTISEKKLNSILKKNEKIMINLLSNIAKKHKEIEVVVKYKTGEGNFYTQIDNPPKNMKFIDGGSGYKLLKNCKLAIGFNSSVLLEAIIASCKVLVVSFGINKKKHQDSLLNYFGYAQYIYDKNILEKKIMNIMLENEIKKIKINKSLKFKYQIGSIDGMSTKRLRQFLIESLINNKK